MSQVSWWKLFQFLRKNVSVLSSKVFGSKRIPIRTAKVTRTCSNQISSLFDGRMMVPRRNRHWETMLLPVRSHECDNLFYLESDCRDQLDVKRSLTQRLINSYFLKWNDKFMSFLYRMGNLPCMNQSYYFLYGF